MAPICSRSTQYFKCFMAENNNHRKGDFDPHSKPHSPGFMTRFATNNTGLLCLFGLLIFPIVLGFALGYLLVILGVSAYKKVTGETSRAEAAKEASQKIQVVLGEKVVDSSFPKTVPLNVQDNKNRCVSGPPTRYYYHRLCNLTNETVNGNVKTYYDESSISGDDTDNGSRGHSPNSVPDVEDSDSSTHASLEDNLDRTEDEDRDEKSPKRNKRDSGVSTEENSPAKRKKGNGSSKQKGSPEKRRLNLPDHYSRESLNQIDFNEAGFIEDDLTPSPVDSSEEKRGRIRFALHYNVAKTELQVNIIKAIDLPIADNKEGINPLVKISLLPQQFCWQRTKVIEGTPDPVYNETFIISGFSKDRMKEYVLRFRVVNFHERIKERYGDDVIGEIHFPLSELKLMENRPSFSITKWLSLKPPDAYGADAVDLGELCVSLCFRPISGRLIVTVTKVRGLPKAIADRTDPYVKLALYCDGLRISKANTRVKRRSLNPVYNEKFNFNVSADQISLTTVVLKVVNHSEVNGGSGSLGMVVLGFDSVGSGQEQWNSMIDSPSRHIEKWHKLHKDIH